jgi:mannose-6-phosphate isomerase-like protein (cupin superfamily)
MTRATRLLALLAVVYLSGCSNAPPKDAPKVVVDDGKPIEGKTKQNVEPFRADWARLKKLSLPAGLDTAGESIHEGEDASLWVVVSRKKVDFHRHDKSDEVLVVLEGVALIHLGTDEKGNAEGIVLEGGQGVLIPAGTMHAIECHPEMATEVHLRALDVFAPAFTPGDVHEVCSLCRDYAKEKTFECPGCGRQLCLSHRGPDVAGKPTFCKGCPAVATPGFVPKRDPAAKKPIHFKLPTQASDKPGVTAPPVLEVARGEHASVQLARVTDTVPAHLHASHSETVFVYEGEGVCHVKDSTGGISDYQTQQGSLFHLPRGRAHMYRAKLNGPAERGRSSIVIPPTRAVSIFSPPYDPADKVPVTESLTDGGPGAAARPSAPQAPGGVEQLPGGTPRR